MYVHTFSTIGAGDAVSSGTLLRWCGSVVLPGESDDRQVISNNSNNDSNNSKNGNENNSKSDENRIENRIANDVKLLKIQDAFSWGLSCGSASCMGQANSVFDISDAINFYQNIKTEKF